jgi:hypothetical protein
MLLAPIPLPKIAYCQNGLDPTGGGGGVGRGVGVGRGLGVGVPLGMRSSARLSRYRAELRFALAMASSRFRS